MVSNLVVALLLIGVPVVLLFGVFVVLNVVGSLVCGELLFIYFFGVLVC